jgi:Na+/H+ antiporter NhaD/arsenite permease-like protein
VDAAWWIDLATFLRYLLLPALFRIAVNIGIFRWRFGAELRSGYTVADAEDALAVPSNPAFFRLTLIVLGLIAGCYVLAAARAGTWV